MVGVSSESAHTAVEARGLGISVGRRVGRRVGRSEMVSVGRSEGGRFGNSDGRNSVGFW